MDYMGLLSVKLAADYASLQNDLKRAESINSRYADNMGTKWNDFASKMGKAVGIGVSIAATAMVALTKNAIDSADELSKMSQKVGISVESLSAMKYQAGLAGVELKGMETSLARFSRSIGDAALGSKEQSQAFASMGISIKDVNGILKPTETLIREVADRFSSMKDGAEKVTLAQKLMGRSGADMIVMLNEGSRGFDAAAQEAREFGRIVSTEAAKQAEVFNDNLDRLKGAAMGAANQLAEELLPTLVDISSRFSESAKSSDEFAVSAFNLGNRLFDLSDFLKRTKVEAVGLREAFFATGQTFAGVGEILQGVMPNLGYAMSSAARAAVGDVHGAAQDFNMAGQVMSESWERGAGRITSAWSSASSTVKATANDFSSVVGGAQYSTGLFVNVLSGVEHAAEKADSKIKPTGNSTGKLGKSMKDAAGDAEVFAKSLDHAFGALDRLQDMAAGYTETNIDLAAQLAGMDDVQIDFNRAMREAQAEFEKLLELGPPTAEAYAALGSAMEGASTKANLTRALDDQRKAMDAAKRAAEEYEQAVKRVGDQIGDAFGQAAVDAMRGNEDAFKNLGDSLVNIAADVVQQIISEFLKLKVINPMLNSIFGTSLQTGGGSMFGGGGGGNWMQAVMGMFGGGAYTNTLAMGANGATGMMGAGVGADWTSYIGTASTGANLLGTGAGAYAAYSNTLALGANGAVGAFGAGVDVGAGTAAAATGGAGMMSTIAAAMPYVALIMFAMSMGDKWFKQGWDPNDPINADLYDKGFMEAGMSGDLKGIGGNTLVDWTVLQTDKWLQDWFGMSESSAAMWSGSSGIMRAWGYKKPEIDWSEMFWNFGAEGVDGSNLAHIKAKGGWFRSDKTWDETADLSDETRKQLELFWAKLGEDTAEFAKKYSLDAAQALEAEYTASFTGGGEFITSTGMINGRAYEGDTAEQFLSRLQSESFLALVAQSDEGLDAAVEKYRLTAESLADATRVVLGIYDNLSTGMRFLGTESDATTSDVLAFVEGLQKAGESVADAFMRLQAANQAYWDFVGQFAAPTQYVDDFQASLAGIHDQLIMNIDQANALARAAGAEGAATEDLVNIHAYATRQFTALLNQLKAQAQSLAFAMGLSDIGSLDQIDAEIARLEGIAGNASQPIRDFGSAMSEAANRASDAINLLLGDLSPLNDRQKLETARAGLMAGAVSQEEFLQIARRLFASSKQYEREFAFAQQFTGRGTGGGRDNSGSIPGTTTGGLTQADRDRLELLYEQRDFAAGQADYMDAQRLAQQIAEISSASGEDIEDVIAELGIDSDARMQEFAERLHLDNADQLMTYIENWQKQLDSNGQNTASIVDAIDRLGDRILGVTDDGRQALEGDSGRNGRTAEGESRDREEQRARHFAEVAGRHFGRVVEDVVAGTRTRSNRPGVRD